KKSKTFESFKVYIIKCWNEDEVFFKIGRTYRKIEDRFINKKEMPYKYKVVHIIENESSEYIYKLEHRLKREHKNYKYTPNIKFNGMYECFSKIHTVTIKEKEVI